MVGRAATVSPHKLLTITSLNHGMYFERLKLKRECHVTTVLVIPYVTGTQNLKSQNDVKIYYFFQKPILLLNLERV